MLRSSRNEFVVEGYQVGMWMKRTSERIREKKEQEEKEREKERRLREKEREDKEKSRKKEIEKIKSFYEKSCVQIIEKFDKELKNIVTEYLREKKKGVEKESFDYEDKIQEREEEKEKQQNEINVEKRKEGEREERVAEEVILETTSYPNLLPSCDSVVQQVGDEISKEVPYNFVPNIRLRHLVDIIPSAPLLTRPAFQTREEVPPKEIEDEVLNDFSNTVGKPWQTTTLTPSPKFSCGFICWDTPNSVLLSNNSFISLEENEMNEAELYQGVDTICELWNDEYVLESQEKEDQANPSTDFAKFSNVEVTYDGFKRITFDPGG